MKSNKELNWEDSPVKYCKTLTKIAYNEDDEPEYWGFTAWKEMLDGDEDKTLRLFEFFKMGLQTHDHIVKDTSGTAEKNANDVIVDYLTLLFDKIKEDLTRKIGKEIEPGEIIWCLTIPAIWKDSEKAAMRKAAYRAGMIEVEDPPEDAFMLVLEPEAAAVYCMMQLKRQGSPLREGEKFLVLDAGGGTVDLTAHTYTKGKLKEITSGTGGACGSSVLDKKFETLLCELFGEQLINDFKRKYPIQHFELMSNWESTKCRTKDLGEKAFITAPGVLNSLLKKNGVKSANFDSDCNTIILPSDHMTKIYVDTLDQISLLIEDQFSSCISETNSPFDYVFIVGGFGGSVVLQKLVRDKFGARVKKGIVVPPEPGEAIVDGALYLGADPSIIYSRRMRMTYGCSSLKPFILGTHTSQKKKTIGAKDYCMDCFDKYVTIGEEVEFDKGISRIYKASFANQKSMSIAVFGTLVTNMTYVDESASKKIGEIIVDMSDTTGGINRAVDVTMFFGKSEIKLNAIEKNSGKKYEAVIRFEGGLFETTEVPPQEPEHNYHVIFANDISSSMGGRDVQPSLEFLKYSHGNRVGALYEACYAFLDQRSASNDIVSCVLYQSSASICFEQKPLSTSLVRDYMMNRNAGGGTDFLSPMKSIESILSRSPHGYTPIALFMTDGECSDGGSSSILHNMMTTYSHLGFKLHTVGVGSSSNHALLRLFADIGGGSFSSSGLNLTEMKQTYTHLAGRLE